MLVPRTMQAVRETGYRKLAIAGGVAANSRIRGDFKTACEKLGATLTRRRFPSAATTAR